MSLSTAIAPSARARALAIQTAYRDTKTGRVRFLPIRLAIFGQGASASTYSTDKAQVFTAFEVGNTYGFGSPLHLAALQLLPPNGDGVGTIPVTVYPLVDDGAGAPSAGDITPIVTAALAAVYQVDCNNILSQVFSVAAGAVLADITLAATTAINATPEMPIIATDNSTAVAIAAKWDGVSGDDLNIAMIGPVDQGVTYSFTQPTAGATNPSVSAALAQIGNVWETFGLNCFEYNDDTTMDLFAAFDEGRRLPSVNKPMVVFAGMKETAVATPLVVSDARKTDRTNAYLTSIASRDLPLVIAARELARIAKVANDNPPEDYGEQNATGLTPGADGSQWNEAMREAAFQGGCSTNTVEDGVVLIGDVITFYHPTGDTEPAYRYVVDQVKTWQAIYNTRNIFTAAGWAAAPMIPDDQPTVNKTAKKPKMAIAALSNMIQALGDEAIISDPKTAKQSVQAGISSQNPKRLDCTYTIQLSGNTNQKSVDMYFGFYHGTAPVVG